MVKNPPSNTRDTDLCCGKIPHIAEQHNYWAPVLRAHILQHKKPPQWEAQAPQPNSSLHLLQLEEACAHQWWPSAVKINTYLKNSKWGFPGGARGKDPTCQCMRHETWVRSLGREDSLEEDTATHSSIPAWRVPWTAEAAGLQSIGLRRVRHNWSN